jgi:peptide deformylase
MKKEKCLIYTYGAPVLRQKAKRITVFDEDLKKLAHKMLCDMYTAQGIGLAAPQAGESIQLIVIDLQQKESEEQVFLDGRSLPIALVQPLFLVNPTWRPVHNLQVEKEEGCLSLPDVRGNVKRFFEIILEYCDLDGNPHRLQCRDLLARCVQHECDHLNGILFIDHLSKKERNEQRELLDEIKTFGGTYDYAEEAEAV